MIDFADETTTSCSLVEDGRTRQERLDALDDAIATLSAHLQAATYRLLVLIRAFDAEDGWADQGFASCAAWLSWRTGVGGGAAREKVRVARALAELPVLSAAMAAGELSYSMARAITRVATPENEAELVETARHVSAAQMERLIRSGRAADRAEAAEIAAEAARPADRELRLVAEPDGSWRISGRLDPETGAALQQALAAAEEALFRRERDEASDGEAGAGAEPAVPAAARRADAIGRVAEAALGRGLAAEAGAAPDLDRADRYQVVVHVAAEDLVADGDVSAETSGGGRVPAETPRIEGGPAIAAATARRLACDAARVAMVRGERGGVLDVGRRTRAVPAAIRRALAVRDGGCTFPGCGARVCDAHHLLPWAAGGPTSLANLVLLCRRHHRLVHEAGWTVERREEGDGPARFVFRRPDGAPLPRVPDRPPAPERPVEALVRRHRTRGLAIDAWTATPDWDGEAMDVELVLQALRPGPLPGRRNAPFPADTDAEAGTGAGDVSAETSLGGGREDDGDDGRWRPLRTWGEDDPADPPPPSEH